MRKAMTLAVVAIAALGLGSVGIIAVTTMDGAPTSTTLPEGPTAVATAGPSAPAPVRTIATPRQVEPRRAAPAVPVVPVVALEARAPSLLIGPPPAPVTAAGDPAAEIQNVAYGHYGRGGGGRR